jgi:hypothetical protein
LQSSEQLPIDAMQDQEVVASGSAAHHASALNAGCAGFMGSYQQSFLHVRELGAVDEVRDGLQHVGGSMRGPHDRIQIVA